MIDLLCIDDLLDPAACTALREEFRTLAGAPAALLGATSEGRVAPRVRRVTRMTIAPATAVRLTALLMDQKATLESHFDVALGPCEPPQFLRYEPGDFFVPHQDGNTPLIHDQSRFRRVSVVLFLSAPSATPLPEAYGGGELIMHGHYAGPPLRQTIEATPGRLAAFRSETTHEVTPVTHGERFSVVSWFPAA